MNKTEIKEQGKQALWTQLTYYEKKKYGSKSLTKPILVPADIHKPKSQEATICVQTSTYTHSHNK